MTDKKQRAVVAFRNAEEATALYCKGHYITLDIEEAGLDASELGIFDKDSPDHGVYIWEADVKVFNDDADWNYINNTWRELNSAEWALLRRQENPLGNLDPANRVVVYDYADRTWKNTTVSSTKYEELQRLARQFDAPVMIIHSGRGEPLDLQYKAAIPPSFTPDKPGQVFYLHDEKAARESLSDFSGPDRTRRWHIPVTDVKSEQVVMLSLNARSYREMLIVFEVLKQTAKESKVPLVVGFDTETHSFKVRPSPELKKRIEALKPGERIGVSVDDKGRAMLVDPAFKMSKAENAEADRIFSDNLRRAMMHAYYYDAPSAAMTDPKTVISELPLKLEPPHTANPVPGYDYYGNKLY